VISESQLRERARTLDVQLGFAEKDYVNSWILWAIYTSRFGDSLLFKGGTALSKLYFPRTWRYSEDLDFGVDGEYDGDQDTLRRALEEASRLSGIAFEVTKHRELHTDGYPTHYVDIDVQYSAVLGQKNTTSLDVMIDEYLAFEATQHEHSLADVPSFALTAYTLEEIFAEKLRSLYQRAQARDYYDLYRMIMGDEVDPGDILPAFEAKCKHDGLTVNLSAGAPAENHSTIEREWENTLPRLVSDVPPFEEVHREIGAYLESVEERR
jgi:predicted nucleotidyltransferase component of viral defense system